MSETGRQSEEANQSLNLRTYLLGILVTIVVVLIAGLIFLKKVTRTPWPSRRP